MFKVILPTSALMHAHSSLAPLLDFAEEGIKGVVRDMVLASDLEEELLFSSREIGYAQYSASHPPHVGHYYLREYENSPQAASLLWRENTVYTLYVETALDTLQCAVKDMMLAFAPGVPYEISKQKWGWLGNDLIIEVKFAEPADLRRARQHCLNFSRRATTFLRRY